MNGDDALWPGQENRPQVPNPAAFVAGTCARRLLAVAPQVTDWHQWSVGPKRNPLQNASGPLTPSLAPAPDRRGSCAATE